MTVEIEKLGTTLVVTITRPEVRNAVDRATAAALVEAFELMERDDDVRAAVLTGAGGNFCAGADLKAVAAGDPNRLEVCGPGPMGPTRMSSTKPVLAAVEGHAVAGGLELALWCDLRVAATSATFGVFCRRWGVPLIDGGTVRLPRLIGQGRALDMILTGRPVRAEEAHRIGLVDRVVADGDALSEALHLAEQISEFPQACLRADRANAFAAFDTPLADALTREFERSLSVALACAPGVMRFAQGAARVGSFDNPPTDES